MSRKRSSYGVTVLVWLLLVVIFGSVALQAAGIHWDPPVISESYDLQQNRPVNLVQTLPDTTKEIWASTWLQNAPADTPVTINWFYFDNNGEKSIIYQEHLKCSGTKPIFSRFDERKAEYFPATKYRVEFVAKNGPTAFAEFRIVSVKKQSTNNDLDIETTDDYKGPSAQDDENLKADIVKNYPEIKKRLAQLELYREESLDNAVSLILPTSWPTYAESAPILFHRKSADIKKGGEITVVRTIIEPENLSRHSPAKILKVYASRLLSPGDKIIRKLRIAKLQDFTIASVQILRKISKGRKVHFYTMQLGKKGTLILIDVGVPPSELELGGFLNALALYSLWTDENSVRSGTIKHLLPVTPTVSKKKVVCRPPGIDKDRKMIRRILERLSGSNKKIRTLSLVRYTDPSGRFSLIIPSKWAKTINSDADTPLQLDTKRRGYEYQYSVKILPVEVEKLRKLSPGQVVQVVGESVFESVREDARKKRMRSEMANPLTSVTRDVRAYGYALMRLSDRTGSAWVAEVVHYDGERVYLLTFLTDDPDPDLVQWFQSLGLNSFWTPNFCK